MAEDDGAEGFVLDVTPDPARGEMVLWVRTFAGPARAWRFPFAPSFFVHARAGGEASLRELARVLGLVPGVREPTWETRLLGLSEEARRVLKVTVRDAARLLQVARMVDARGEHRDLDLYDVDLRPSQRFLSERGLFPFARVKRDPATGSVVALDDAWTLEYAPPPLRRLDLALADPDPRLVVRPETRVRALLVDGERIEGSEASVLREAAERVAARDPDLVVTEGGDRWMLRYLHHRAEAAGLPGWSLSREARLAPPPRGGRSFFQYGHIKYRAPTFPLAGRIHLDVAESFFFGEAGLGGVVDMARISGIPLGEIARLEAGTAVTAIEIDHAKREGRIIPWKKNTPEKPKTLRALVKADRGGYIFDPVVGLHEDVIELDFASLYPTLIARHNLGSETILCSCCAPETLPPETFVPQAGYHVCGRRRGLVPRVLEKLVDRRAQLKRIRKRTTDEAERRRLQGRIDAYKWLNVVAFGYQGYKNARFGCIEAHEATCAWARESLLTAAEVAREEGYEFLHGIVDSLWLRRASPAATSAEAVARRVEQAVGVRFEPQGRYHWIVFLPTRAHQAPGAAPIGAPNRFYGLFDRTPDAPSRSQMGQDADDIAGGRLKVRGIEYRQGSTCRFVAAAQKAALEELARASSAAEFHARVPRAIAAARPFVRRLRDGATAIVDLVVRVNVGAPLDGRRQMNHGHAALRQLARRGVEVAAGDRVEYVITDASSREPGARVRELRLGAPDRYDAAAYEALLARALASILLPLGYDEARVREELEEGRPRQMRLATG